MGEGVIAFCVIVCVVAAGLAWWAVEIRVRVAADVRSAVLAEFSEADAPVGPGEGQEALW